MKKSKYLRVTFDPETNIKVFQETNHLQVVSDDAFTYLKWIILRPMIMQARHFPGLALTARIPEFVSNLYSLI